MRSLFLMLIVVLTWTSAAFAQTTGVVVADQATIWRLNAVVVLATVKAGTKVEITARSDRWYEIIVPQSLGGRGEHGLIAVSQVKLDDGSTPPPTRAISPRAPAQRPTTRRNQPVSFRAFGGVGLMIFTASQSFEAVLGQSHGPTFGGGGQIRSGSFYLEGSIDRFKKTGERVFVFEQTVFPLGIPSTITITPIMLAAGYRFGQGTVVPYVGGGVGTYLLTETSRFDAAGESVDERHAAYRALGGVEFKLTRRIAAAVEGQYTRVPDALGSNGASAAFDEHDLGGFQGQFKVVFGR